MKHNLYDYEKHLLSNFAPPPAQAGMNRRASWRSVCNGFSKQFLTVFHYRLPEGMERAHIVITTMEGKPITRIPADTAAGQVRWNAESCRPGIYFYHLAVGRQTLFTGRLVIIH